MYINQLTNTITFYIWYLCHFRIRLAHKKYMAFLWKSAPLRTFTANRSSPGLKLWDCFHVIPSIIGHANISPPPLSLQCPTVLYSFTPMPGTSMGKNLPAKAGDADLIPESGWCPEEGNGNPLQYSCLRNPKDRGAWWATVQGIAKSQTRLKHIYTEEWLITSSMSLNSILLSLWSILWDYRTRISKAFI